ncbi:hypothetical protein Tco_1058471 [Tanacetum coccineum]|uniref:Uncharacterized protein n=1 Tax=Tanacetum coccineum TaxID=301880 RepID=A0ABQ5H8H3_9ASTR
MSLDCQLGVVAMWVSGKVFVKLVDGVCRDRSMGAKPGCRLKCSPHKKLAKTNRLLSLFKTKPTRFKRYKSFFYELQGRYGYLFAHLRARFMPRKSFDTLVDNLYYVMVETLPAMVDKHIKEQVVKQVPELVRNQVLVYVAEGLILERQKAKEETERLIAKAILQEHGNIQAQIKTHIDNAIPNVIPS